MAVSSAGGRRRALRRVWASPSIPMPVAATGVGSVRRATVRRVSRGPSVPVATVATQPSSDRAARVSPRGADPVRAGFSGGGRGGAPRPAGCGQGGSILSFDHSSATISRLAGYLRRWHCHPHQRRDLLVPASLQGAGRSRSAGMAAGSPSRPPRGGGCMAPVGVRSWPGSTPWYGMGWPAHFFFIRGGRSNSGCSCMHRHVRAAVWKIGRAGAAG